MLCLAWAPRGHPAAQRRGCGGNQPSQGGHSFGHSMYVCIFYVFLVPSLDGLGRSWHLTIGCCRGKGKRPPKFRIQIKSMLRTQNPEPHEQHSEQTLYLNLDMVAMTSKLMVWFLVDVNIVLHQWHIAVNDGYVDGGFLSSVASHVGCVDAAATSHQQLNCTGEAIAKNIISSLLYQVYRTNQETWYTWWSNIAHA